MKQISFAYDFVSYLLGNIDKKIIKRIFLFGSLVRGEATKSSDVDIFIETKEDIQNKVNNIIDRFYNSAKYIKYWKPLGINNQINVIVGKLEDFKDLRRSIIGNGLVMYSSFMEEIGGKNYALFIVEFKGQFKDKVRLWRKLYGSMQTRNKKKYISKGIVEENEGEKLAKGVFVVPIENSNDVIKELRRLKIKYKLIEVSSDML